MPTCRSDIRKAVPGFGFPIEQIRELIALTDAPGRDRTTARDVADLHLTDVRRKLKELRALGAPSKPSL